ncbi:MAG: DUF2064 domain-containing protein, partial [Bacteroidota bacterium]
KRFRGDWNHRDNAQVAKGMLLHSLEVAQSSGLPFFWVGAEEQKGDTFGERLSQAFQQVFSKGYDNVIAIGDDCPELNRENLIHSAELLASGQAVVGPAQDGGVYLIGLSVDHFEASAFDQLAWTSDQLELELQNYLRRFGQMPVCLVVKSDIDSAEDFKQLLRRIDKRHFLWKWIKGLFYIPRLQRFLPLLFEHLPFFHPYYIPRPPPYLI